LAVQVIRRTPRRRTIAFVLVFAFVALFVIGSFAESQGKPTVARNDEKDPRNNSKQGLGKIHGSNPADDCWQHHKGEGMRDTVIVYPILPAQFQVGKPYIVPVQIINPWKQELQEMSLEVALLGETQVLSVQGQAASAAASIDRRLSFGTCLGPPAGPASDPLQGPVSPYCGKDRFSFVFDVPSGAKGIVGKMEINPGAGSNSQRPDEYTVGFRMSTSRIWAQRFPPDNETGLTNRSRDLAIEVTGAGRGIIEVVHRLGDAISTNVSLDLTIVMGQGPAGAKAYTIKIPFDKLLKQSAGIVEVPMTPFAKGTQKMEFKVRSKLYYKHQDPATPNEDYYERFANLSGSEDLIRGNSIVAMRAAVVGDSFVASPYGAAATPEAAEDWKFILAETSGFAAAGLLAPSLLLGGTYGKGSRRFFNNLLGGAKRRVMYHNLMSLGLSLVALVHIWLFMLEIRYTILMGVVWGGLGALSLLVLGLTGYYQVPLIQRHGYKWWRYVHLVFGLLVVFFVSYHAIADGPDFFFIKEQLPKWINGINLAQK
jgi:hypothetical protein